MAAQPQIVAEKSQQLREQLIALQKNLQIIECTKGPIDFSGFDWAWPLTTAPLAAIIHESKSKVINCSSYLQTIGFPNGIDSVDSLRSGCTYLPIVRIPTIDTSLIERMASRFSELVLSYIDFAGNLRNAWSYTVGELVDNISQHSRSQSGWLFAQYWPDLEYMDLVILDTGHGFRRVYEEAEQRAYTDQQAIRAALQGRSVKPDKERGYGLHTTRNLIIGPEIRGKFLIISGGSGYYADSDRELWLKLGSWQWNGAIILCRIRRVQTPVDIYKYVEG